MSEIAFFETFVEYCTQKTGHVLVIIKKEEVRKPLGTKCDIGIKNSNKKFN